MEGITDILGRPPETTPSKIHTYELRAGDVRWDGNNGWARWGYFPEKVADIKTGEIPASRASRRIKDAPTLTEEEQQELYAKAETNVKSTSIGAVPLWNLNADPYATAVGYKNAEKYNVKGFGEGKTIEEVIEKAEKKNKKMKRMFPGIHITFCSHWVIHPS